MTKHTIEYLKTLFVEYDCILLENTYINSKQLLKFKCSCGKEDLKTIFSFRINPQCRYCSGQSLDYISVKKVYENNNCILLEDTFKNSATMMNFECFCGRKDIKNFNTFKKLPKCRFCAEESRRTQRTKSFEEVKKNFESKGNELLSTEYIPGKKLKYICDCGKIDYKIIHKFIAGERCLECGLKKNANNRRHSQEHVENLFTINGCKLLSEYTGDEQKLEYICKCGKKALTTYHTFKKCKNCWECGRKKHIISKEQISDFIIENNLDFISFHTFEKSKKGKLLLRCKCGTEYEKTWNALKSKKCTNACIECTKKQKIEKMSGENHPSWLKDRERVEFRKQYAKKIYSMLRRCYQKFNYKKEDKSFESLGYSHYELGSHITNHPNYKNAIKNGQMHIDHIFPIQAFLDYGLCEKEHIKIINSLENLQPLDALDNMSKNDKYDREAFIKFLASKGIYLENNREYIL